jgi:hypothetical protein
MNSKVKILGALLVAILVDEIAGHGMLMDPVNRASRWKVDGSNPRDYNDMEGFCGGFNVQWSQNGGKCGLCGDNYSDARPRRHELGGMFGAGVIMKTYKQGATIPVTVKLTANHKGYFYFKICNLDNEVESDACFERYSVATSAGPTWPLTSNEAKDYIVTLQLPSNLYCNHCVLQWTYVCGELGRRLSKVSKLESFLLQATTGDSVGMEVEDLAVVHKNTSEAAVISRLLKFEGIKEGNEILTGRFAKCQRSTKVVVFCYVSRTCRLQKFTESSNK